MIARVTGRLEEVRDGSALLDVGGGLWYEVFIPACDMERLSKKINQDVILYTIHYMEGDPSHGAITPRLVGFLAESDRKFFRLFTTVKGIGARKALRALARPVGEIASAIQAKDARFLRSLPEIGPRMSEQIIAELNGKVDDFAGPASAEAPELPEGAAEALAVLVQLGEKRPDAQALVERVLAVSPDIESTEEIIQQAYKIKAGGG
ncbi:MAG: Holliday junction DNA helicase RuvA [Planctomycetes bacterium]|nr:Holliday junction DNA helicase RuvA [Planctomycetota bacterium]